MPDQRALSRYGYMAAAVFGAWAIILAPRFFAPHLRGPPSPTWIVILSAATALAIAWALVFATLAFRRMDEFQQTASKFAWYWGGSIGLAASLPLFVFVYLGGLHWLDPARFHLGPERDWSQAELARRLDVSRQSVNAIETGKYDPSLPLAFKIARLFGQTIETIFAEEG
jgi:putative transcriptional regulator